MKHAQPESTYVLQQHHPRGGRGGVCEGGVGQREEAVLVLVALAVEVHEGA